jgi:hypothetical protein
VFGVVELNCLEEHTNSLLKKSPTSSVVEGPPMFMKTIAVGPFEPAASCVTGGFFASPARVLLCCHDEVEADAHREI